MESLLSVQSHNNNLGKCFLKTIQTKKKVMFDIFLLKKQRERMANLKLNKRWAALTNEKNRVQFNLCSTSHEHLHKKESDILWITTADLYKLHTEAN